MNTIIMYKGMKFPDDHTELPPGIKVVHDGQKERLEDGEQIALQLSLPTGLYEWIAPAACMAGVHPHVYVARWIMEDFCIARQEAAERDRYVDDDPSRCSRVIGSPLTDMSIDFDYGEGTHDMLVLLQRVWYDWLYDSAEKLGISIQNLVIKWLAKDYWLAYRDFDDVGGLALYEMARDGITLDQYQLECFRDCMDVIREDKWAPVGTVQRMRTIGTFCGMWCLEWEIDNGRQVFRHQPYQVDSSAVDAINPDREAGKDESTKCA